MPFSTKVIILTKNWHDVIGANSVFLIFKTNFHNKKKYEKKSNKKPKFSTMSYVGQFEFFTIIYTGNSGLSLRHNIVVHNVVG